MSVIAGLVQGYAATIRERDELLEQVRTLTRERDRFARWFDVASAANANKEAENVRLRAERETLAAALRLAKHKMEQTLDGQYPEGQALRAAVYEAGRVLFEVIEARAALSSFPRHPTEDDSCPKCGWTGGMHYTVDCLREPAFPERTEPPDA